MRPRRLPKRMKWLFWNVDLARIDPVRDAEMIIARVVEYGTLEDVRWILRVYGRERIHTFFRTVGSPEISDKTVAFWRAVFNAEGETWPRPAAWRRTSSAPWIEQEGAASPKAERGLKPMAAMGRRSRRSG